MEMVVTKNVCGGKEWRIDGSGYIEVPGEGYPMYEPGSERFEYMVRTWENWAPYFREAAAEFGVPVSYLLAIASIETGLWSGNPNQQATIGSYAGAVGVMQIMQVAKRQIEIWYPDKTFGAREDPRENVRMGAAMVRKFLDTGNEFPAVGSMYNAGPAKGMKGPKCCPGRNEWNFCADHDYPRAILTWHNTALEHLDLGTAFPWGPVIAASLVAASLAVVVGVRTKRLYLHPDTGRPWLTVHPKYQGLPLFG